MATKRGKGRPAVGLTLEEAERAGVGHLHPARGKVVFTRGPKYKAKPTDYAGVRYASKAEAARAAALDLWAAAAPGRWWVGQPKFRLGVPENVYVADFLVVDGGSVRVEDVKGVETAKFKRDKKLWASYGPCPLWLIKKGRVAEVVAPAAADPAPGPEPERGTR